MRVPTNKMKNLKGEKFFQFQKMDHNFEEWNIKININVSFI